MSKTNKQLLGERGEILVTKNCPCPKCKSEKSLKRLPAYFKCADIVCDFCGYLAPMVFVHGHYQCTQCHQVCVTCCEGSSNFEIQIPIGKETQKTNISINF